MLNGSTIPLIIVVSALYVTIGVFLFEPLVRYYREWGKFWILSPDERYADRELIGENEIGGVFLAGVWPLSLVWIFLMWVVGCGRPK